MKCLNPKLLVGLAALAVGLYVVAPELAVAALPLLLFALCPLVMFVMMKQMGSMSHNAAGDDTDSGAVSTSQLTDGVQSESSPQDDAAASRPTIMELQSQLQSLQAQQTAIADQLHARSRGERQQANGQRPEAADDEAVITARQYRHTELDDEKMWPTPRPPTETPPGG